MQVSVAGQLVARLRYLLCGRNDLVLGSALNGSLWNLGAVLVQSSLYFSFYCDKQIPKSMIKVLSISQEQRMTEHALGVVCA